MKELYNTTLEIKNLDKVKYDLLIEFLDDNYINYEETDFEEFIIDNRTEEEKYEDHLSQRADMINDERKLEE